MTTTDSQNVRIAITTSVVVHVLLLLMLAWIMGLEAVARRYLTRRGHVEEVPKVALLFPELVIPTPALKPRLKNAQYIRTTQNDPAAKPVKSDFFSDHNTRAAAAAAPFPDGDQPMPTTRGGDRPTHELVNRDSREGKPTPPVPAPPKPALIPRQPQEPLTVPQLKPREMAKADASTIAKLMEDTDKEAGRIDVTKLPLQVKKAESASSTKSSPAPPPAPLEPARQKPEPEGFSPMTRTARVKGTITSKGEASVDAEATPMGRFGHSVTDAVDKTWHEYWRQRGGDVASGYLKVRFYVNRDGHVDDLKFIEKSGDALMDSFTLDAILHTEIGPIPRDLLPLLEDERLPVEYEIIIQ